MSINCYGILAEGVAQYNIGSFSAYTGQAYKGFHITGNLTAMLGQ
jgi:hypothetical protein